MSTPGDIYDKAGWHLDEVRRLGLPDARASQHLAFLIRWLASERALTEVFWERMRTGPKRVLPASLEDWGEVELTEDMVAEEMRPFIAGGLRRFYFSDYTELLAAGLPSMYHAEYSDANFARIAARLDERLAEWRSDPAPMPAFVPSGCSLVLRNTVLRSPRGTALGCLLLGLGIIVGMLWGAMKFIEWVFDSLSSVVRGTALELPLALLIIAGAGWFLWKSTRPRH